jgi:hypothetical protein
MGAFVGFKQLAAAERSSKVLIESCNNSTDVYGVFPPAGSVPSPSRASRLRREWLSQHAFHQTGGKAEVAAAVAARLSSRLASACVRPRAP